MCVVPNRTVSFRSRVLPPNSVWMEDAKLKGLEVCFPQVRGGQESNDRKQVERKLTQVQIASQSQKPQNLDGAGPKMLILHNSLFPWSPKCLLKVLSYQYTVVNDFSVLSYDLVMHRPVCVCVCVCVLFRRGTSSTGSSVGS